ncbi:YraN family protein [Alkanindiges sp. WGS2144]|uniref:YraN family protein n=1 Tax=Alkanindiges sp. WGS2144 TaxID=3366808 RepID=UPI0037535CE0
MTVGRSSSPTHQTGAAAEEVAARFLCQQGFELVAQNFNTRLGEIDLIVKKSNLLIFVEVRQRRAGSMVNALESITVGKQRKITRSAMIFLQRHKQYENFDCRFDVVALTAEKAGNGKLEWIPAAFNVA